MNAESPISSCTPRRPLQKLRAGGFSLVELMVSITIGLILLSGMTALLVQQTRDRIELQKVSQQIENGRYAMQVLQDAIEHAGFYGEFSSIGNAPATMPDPCATTFPSADPAMALHVQGYNSPSAAAARPSCLAQANHLAGTDILVIRRADNATTTVADALPNQIYLQATQAPQTPPVTQDGVVIGTIATVPSVFTMLKKDRLTLAELRKYHVDIYFISPCSVPSGPGNPATCTTNDDNGAPIPTLKRLELTAGAGTSEFQLVPLAEGIENMQFDYGLDDDKDGAPDSYTAGTYSTGTTPMAPADWANVMTIRANLLARNNESSTNYSDPKTYLLNGPDTLGGAGAISPTGANFKRHVFTEVIRLPNPSGRRER